MHPLHAIVTASVGQDAAPAGFSGRLCFGIAEAERRLFLLVDVDRREVVTSTTAPSADVTLLLGGREASALLAGEALPSAPLVALTGQRELLERFCRRYLKTLSLVGVRL